MITLAERMNRIQPSATMQVAAKAQQLRAAGKDIISLSAGEPDFSTPEHICAAAITAIESGDTHYTPADGTMALKKAITEKLKRDNQLDYQPDEIGVSNGAKHTLYNLFCAVLNPGDEVLIPAPYWVSYPDMVKLCDGTPIIMETSEKTGLKITPEQLDLAITDKTKLLVINSPSNPSGAVYSKAELAALGKVLKKYPHVWVVSDDIYEHILWSGEPYSNILNACPELRERTVVVNGASKGYAMTGWRIGFAAAPASLIAVMRKLQSQSTSNPCSISQAAAVAAFAGDQSCLESMCQAFKARHDYFVAALNELPGIACAPAHGSFYAYPNVSGAVQALGLEDDIDFANHILEQALVAGVPGSAFGTPGYMRFSFATSMDALEKAIAQMQKVLS